MVKVGWMVDPGLPRAGMVLSVEAFERALPDGWELYRCRDDVKPPDDVDVFVLHGDLFGRHWIDVLKGKPLLAHRHGGWIAGDPVFRRWVLENASLVTFNSPKQFSLFRYPVDVAHDFVPLPVDISDVMRKAVQSRRMSDTNIFLGLIVPAKGVQYTLDWAIRKSRRVDFYGVATFRKLVEAIVPPCEYCGPVDYTNVPALLGRYENFVFMPHETDLYARVTVEAWAAGCNLILEGDQKAFFKWFDPDECEKAPKTFWDKVGGILYA